MANISHSASSYRTHTCGELSTEALDEHVILSGWVHCKRNHGQLLFVDVRDHYGITQCVIEASHEFFSVMEHVSLESVVRIQGKVTHRPPATVNTKLPTGAIEVLIQRCDILSSADPLPFPIAAGDADLPEESRLQYRFLDLRRHALHERILLRSQIIAFLRQQMMQQGFLEIQTPILSASSPEGARDFVIPSRLYPGEVYALPQAPQQFKQLLMMSGYDKYFQIAPCFRDEDSRADRSPGEFYQLDFEMSFVTQEDIFHTLEPVLYNTFSAFAPHDHVVAPIPFPRIPYEDALVKYGTDKPDLRNPLMMEDVTEALRDIDFDPFQKILQHKNGVIRILPVPEAGTQSRKFLKDAETWAKAQGCPGLGYMLFRDGKWQGPMAKFLRPKHFKAIGHGEEETIIFFLCEKAPTVTTLGGKLRTYIAQELNLMATNTFAFCWIVDFPLYEKDEETGAIGFSHNPFSMPQGELEALTTQDPLTIKAYQYDVVCNGYELSSGAIRNHRPDIMLKAFELAGYSKEHVEKTFKALFSAFHYGAPPHGGAAPGIDRMVMLLANTANIREVIAFPLNQRAQDPLLGAPSPLPPERWAELHIRPVVPPRPSTS